MLISRGCAGQVAAGGIGWFERIRLPGSTAALIRRSRAYARAGQKLAGSRLGPAMLRYICLADQGRKAEITASTPRAVLTAAAGVAVRPAADRRYWPST